MNKTPITVSVNVKSSLDKVWDAWTLPRHITGWAFASDDWEAPSAQNDLRVGGKFVTVMAAKDGSAKFDFDGQYTEVDDKKLIAYNMTDGRKVKIEFTENPDGVQISETFDPEQENSAEQQRQGWQAILENFKIYAERQN